MARLSTFRSSPLALLTAVAIAAPSPAIIASGMPQAGTTPPTTTTKPATPQTTTKPPATPQTTTPAATKSPQSQLPADKGWPRTYNIKSGEATVFQPQVESWDNHERLVAWLAVSYMAFGAKEPSLGTIKASAESKVSVADRLVNFGGFTITDSRFPKLDRDVTRDVVGALQDVLNTAGASVISLERVLAAVDTSSIRPKNVDGVKADPPKIFGSSKPAVLVALDGQPVWSPIKDVDLKYAVNTNWDLFQTTDATTFYLRNETSWLKAAAIDGPWSPAGTLPASFKKLPNDENWKDVRANLPGKSISASAVPTVFVSTEPAELLLLTGNPTYEAVADTNLLWISNTESDLFRLGKTGNYFYLVTGRWFSAPGLSGPWTFATPTLPEDFQKIPLEHPRSRVLASVPGTAEANEAVLLAQIPQKARVNKKELKAPDVEYSGDAQFETVTPTTVSRATNTDKDIFKVGDLYYMCFQAVWFMARSPTGPWEVASTVPKEIYEIPPSSPSYHVTYVTVEDDDANDEWVTFAYVAGYTGMMVAWGCMVWGSGWYYPPYVHYGGFYPAYYGYPRTYGMSAWYNPWTGAYGRGVSAYGPYGSAHVAARYNPRTGTYSRGAAAYGPYGGRATAQAFNPRTGTYAQTRQGSNMYGNWGSSSVQRGDNWARSGHVTNYRTGNTTAGIQGSGGGSAVSRSTDRGRTTVGQSGSGDIYAGHDGNVYRKNSDGSWSNWSDGGWNNVNRPEQNRAGTTGTQRQGGQGIGSGTAGAGLGSASTRPSTQPSNIDRDAAARQRGSERTAGSSSFRSSPSVSRAGSYRGGGGGRRGGR